MNDPRIELADGRRAFKPGESVEGRVSWSVDRATSAEVRLFWYTRGKGTDDIGLVDTMAFPNPQTTDQRTFRFACRKRHSASRQADLDPLGDQVDRRAGTVGRAPRNRHVPERTGGRGRS
jgi:hypothetical protein